MPANDLTDVLHRCTDSIVLEREIADKLYRALLLTTTELDNNPIVSEAIASYIMVRSI